MGIMGIKNKAKSVTISFDPSLLRFIDEERGLVTRSRYIDFLLKKQLLPIRKKRAKIKSTPESKGDVNEVKR